MEYRYDKIGTWSGGSVYETWQRKDETEEWVKKFHGEFYKLEGGTWHSKSSRAILKDELGIETTESRANEFESAHDCNSSVVYYLGVATPPGTNDDALKLIMGPISAELNARNIPMKDISKVIPAHYLFHFVEAQHLTKFDRSASKAILAEILGMKSFAVYGEHSEMLDKLYADPKFKPTDSNEVENIIKKLIADNPDQATKAKENEKLAQWFVGQLMKATQGKANPQEALGLIKKQLNAI